MYRQTFHLIKLKFDGRIEHLIVYKLTKSVMTDCLNMTSAHWSQEHLLWLDLKYPPPKPIFFLYK